MRITDVNVDGFGGLSQLAIAPFSPGLNVVYGANGSDTTTLLEFLRGVFCGFGTARRIRLVPGPSGVCGGSVGIEWGSRRLVLIRHARGDCAETLSINVRQGLADDASALRRQLETLDEQRLRTLFTGGERATIDGLLQLAHQDRIELSSTPADDAWLRTHRAELRCKRHELLRGPNHEGRIAELVEARDRARERVAEMQRKRQQELERLDEAERHAAATARTLQTEANARHADWQVVVSDLREIEVRL